MVKLKVKDVAFSYANVPVLKDVSIAVDKTEFFGVLGPNGAGKSTLLKCIDRILSPQKGSIVLDGQDIKSMSQLKYHVYMKVLQRILRLWMPLQT